LSLSLEKLVQTNESKAKRINSSINLVVHLQRLFAYMVLTSRKYVDPFAVAINVVDEFGNRFKIGD
jgi:ubiquitin carboxyl-terminal hydrolase 25/28